MSSPLLPVPAVVFDLDACLTTYVFAEEVAHDRPAPDVFLETARRLGAAPVGCVVLEDSAPGAAAAHAAGMCCIAIPYVPASPGGHRPFAGAR